MASKLIHGCFFESASRHPDRPAYWARQGGGFAPLSYAEVAQRVTAVAAGLAQMGFKPGAKAGIYAHNSPEWGITYLAILAAGGVIVPLDPHWKYLELRAIITRAELSHLFCAEGFCQDLLGMRGILDPCPEIFSIEAPESVTPTTKLRLQHIEQLGRGKSFSSPEIDPHGLAVLIFTSGTSAESKGVMLSHANIVADVEAIKPRLDVGPDDRFLSVLPLHHTFEATCGFLFPLMTGASIAYAQSLKSAEILADIRALKVTLMCGVPLLFEKMYAGIQRAIARRAFATRLYVDLGQRFAGLSKWILDLAVGKVLFRSLREQAGLDSIRMFVSGGAAINPEVSKFFNNLGIVLLQGYGLSETSPVVAVNTEKDNNYASVGRPLDGVKIKIVEPNEAGVGEIAAKGGMVMLGYFQNDEATRAVMDHGYFRTGDLGYLDSAGHLHITGRKKNVIITPAGKNIYPEEIEALLESSPFISECAVLPRKKGTGEEPVAVVVPDFESINAAREGEKVADAELRKIIRAEVDSACQQLAEFKRVKDVIVMTEELPKTSTKKVKRYQLIETLKNLGQL